MPGSTRLWHGARLDGTAAEVRGGRSAMMGMTSDEVLEFNRSVIAEFRDNDGVMPAGSLFHGNPTMLVTMIGRRSGRELTSPLSYATDGDGWIIMASAGGSETTPAWAFNLRANPAVTVELLGERFRATAAETAGDERARVFDLMITQLPRFADYQAAVSRRIPLFRLTRD
ncbi:MAG: nitroreductase/quinone reductase family protein [Actinomycetota bacterium]